MLAGAHGWKHESLTLFTHLRNEIFHKARMEKAVVNRWPHGNSRPRSDRGTAGDAPHGAGRGSAMLSAANSSSNPGLPGNTPAPYPAQGKASFGGLNTIKNRLQVGAEEPHPKFQFGSFDVPDYPVPLVVSDVKSVAVDNKEVDRVDDQRPQTSGAVDVDSAPLQNVLDDNSALLPVSDFQSEAVGINGIKLLDSVYEQTGRPPAKSGDEEVGFAPLKNAWGESSALQPKRASPSTNWTTKDAERNKTSDPSSNFLSEADFPALGGHPSGSKARQGQACGARAPGPRPPENVLVPKPGVDSSARAEVAQKCDARNAATSGPEVRGHEQFNLSKRGRGGGGNHWRDGDGECRDAIDSLGRTLTRILRHQASDLKIKLRSDGYVDVQELLKLNMKTASGRPLSSHTVEDVLQAVKQDNKQRFGIKEENRVLLIRANQGHTLKTVETEQLLKPVLTAEEIPVCVHGTYRKFLGPIAKEGLKRMGRNHVHFASGLSPSEGVISGMRKTSEILIYLDVSKALEDGMKLYMSENGVILTEGFDGVVPPKYFKHVMSGPGNKPVHMK